MCVEKQIQDLLSQRWTHLQSSIASLENGKYPGVYLLAYSDKPLEGQSIDLNDIFYVGMSNARGGIRSRLGQFCDGIENGGAHSAAQRFYREHSAGKPFSQTKAKEKFFVVITTTPCVVEKDKRTANDLRKMGDVVRLEYYVLAHIKEALQLEPRLNKK